MFALAVMQMHMFKRFGQGQAPGCELKRWFVSTHQAELGQQQLLVLR